MFARPADRPTPLSAGGFTKLAFDLARLADGPASLARIVDAELTALLDAGERPARVPRPRIEIAEPAPRAVTPMAPRREPAVRPERVFARLAEALIPSQFVGEVESLDHLTVVPVLNLGRVPFGALDPDGDGRPLMERMAINVESSLRSIFEGKVYAWNDQPLAAPVIFGDPDAAADPDWILPRLPGAGREALDVAELMGASAVIGAEATPARLLSMIGGAEYIHIAAHGIADAEAPMDKGFLALSGGRLTARQIQALSLERLPVVVLSACQSGLGGPIEAGIIGVARGFVIAGAAVVIASLWNVDDQATAWIMTRFAEHLKRTGPVEALRRAQLEARQKWPSPQIWAAFIAYGARFVPAR